MLDGIIRKGEGKGEEDVSVWGGKTKPLPKITVFLGITTVRRPLNRIVRIGKEEDNVTFREE